LGGEPLCPENLKDVSAIIRAVREKYPNIRIYVWTGYNFEDLPNTAEMKDILNNIDVLIDGPYIEGLRDTRLKLRGSSNQHIRLKSNGYTIEEKE
jgi:anaerobic ribonucleoside-triphosphate reductase activating protein